MSNIIQAYLEKKISHLGGGYRKQRKSTFAKFHDKVLRIIHALFSTQRVDPNILAIAPEKRMISQHRMVMRAITCD